MPKTNKNIGSKNSRIWIARIFVITLFGGYLFQQGLSPLNALANAPSPAEIEQGNKLFAQNCFSCHGVEGVGHNPESPNGGMLDEGGYLAPALNGTGHAWHHPNSVLFKTIKHDSIASDSSMRAFKSFER